MIRHRFTISLLYLFCCLATACHEEFPADTTGPDGTPVRCAATIEQPDTRVTTEPDGRGRFEAGNTIEIYARTADPTSVPPYSRTLMFDGTEWFPELRWSEIGNRTRFTAWYPVPDKNQTNETLYTHRIETDQSSATGYELSDLLAAETETARGKTVQLTFRHVLSRLNIVLTSDGYSEEELNRATVEIRSRTQTTFDLMAPFETPTIADGNTAWITPRKIANGNFTAILCPQAMATYRTDGWIRVTLDGKEAVFNAPVQIDGQVFDVLEAGKEITVTLTVRKTNETPDEKTTVWTQGLQIPDDSRWNYDKTQLPWWEGCGWYDCNKVNPTGKDPTKINDSQLCWAAATSNMIHWWLDRNRDWVENKGYDVPSELTDMLHSEIFDLYKSCFPNEGNQPLSAINWYFNGVFRKNIYETDEPDPRAGFFRDVFGTHSLGQQIDIVTKETFNSTIRSALENGQIVSYAFADPRWQAHAVTLWGVELDENGDIRYLYMVDNNDGATDTRGTIRRQEIRYKPLTEGSSTLSVFVPNSVGDFRYRIYQIFTLDTGKKYLK